MEIRDADPSMYPASRSGDPIPASAPVEAHWDRLRHGMDQPELRVSSRVSSRLSRAAPHASVTRRAWTLKECRRTARGRRVPPASVREPSEPQAS